MINTKLITGVEPCDYDIYQVGRTYGLQERFVLGPQTAKSWGRKPGVHEHITQLEFDNLQARRKNPAFVPVDDNRGFVPEQPISPRARLLVQTAAELFKTTAAGSDTNHIQATDQAMRIAEAMLKDAGL